MTVTHGDETTSRETSINYAAETTIDGERIHSVEHVAEDGRIVTDCDRWIIRNRGGGHSVETYEEQPEHLTGNNLCYDCVRNYSGDRR